MRLSGDRVRSYAHALLVALLLPVVVSAQTASRSGAPVQGTWGAEAGVGDGESATLLRFQSARWALLAGGSVSSREFDGGSLIGTQRFTSTALRVGARRYARSGLGVRPVVGLGLTILDGSGSDTSVGAYGELGAVYFFNPHVSLGATGTLGFGSSGGGGTNFGLSLARLLGAVYF